MSRRIFCPISGDTILRGLHHRIGQKFPTPRVLGVDDFAFRRGHRYGTVLVDLERHRVVDLLPDREAETLANWLLSHPGVEVISRDRAGAYADGSRRGAPKAIQVADRWHLLKNAVGALERQLWRESSVLKKVAQPAQYPPIKRLTMVTPNLSSGQEGAEVPFEQPNSQSRQRRLERYQQVCDLAGLGYSIRAISLQTGMERKTIRRFLRAGEFPERALPKRRSTKIGPYQNYLRQRFEEQKKQGEKPGVRCGQQLFDEIRVLGYRGGLTLVKE